MIFVRNFFVVLLRNFGCKVKFKCGVNGCSKRIFLRFSEMNLRNKHTNEKTHK